MNISPQALHTIAQVSADIREMLGDDDDVQTLLDTLDGETDAMDMVGALIKHRVEAHEIEVAMKAIAATYTERARRHAEKVNAINKGLGKLLDAMGLPKVAHPLGTVSRTKARQSMKIIDAAEIPTQLCKLVPDNAEIKAQLEAGEAVPGAALVWGDPSITVRIK